jgi:hypothetical protein
VSYKIKTNIPAIIIKGQANSAIFVRMAGEELLRISKPFTPMSAGSDNRGKKSSGNLRRDTLVTVQGLRAIVRWRSEYASYQERGMRKDGTRKVRRYTTPGTGAHFAENAAKKIVGLTGTIARRAGLV